MEDEIPVFDWIASDHHAGHKKISGFCGRPFEDGAEESYVMTENMVEKHNELVSPNDIVWFLGDLALGDFRRSMEAVSRMNGRKFLMPGNHDHLHPYYQIKAGNGSSIEAKIRSEIEIYKSYGFEILPLELSLLLDGIPCTFSHFPVELVKPFDDRYEQWRPSDSSRCVIHGHIHEKWRVKGLQINVGVEAWGGYPVSFRQVIELAQQGAQGLNIIQWER